LNFNILRRLFSFILPYKWQFVGLVLLILGSAILSPILPILVQQTIDGPIAHGNQNELLLSLIKMVGLIGLFAVVSYFSTVLSGQLSQNIINGIRNQVYEKIISLKLSYFDKTQVGKLVTRTVSDVEALSDVFSSGFAAISGDFLQLLLIIGLMFSLDVKLTLISLCTIPPLLLSTYVFKEAIKKSFDEVRTAVAQMNAFVQERLSGMSLVQIFAVEKQELENFKSLNKIHRDANIKSIMYYSIYFPVADVLSALGIGLVVWFGSKGIFDSQLSLGVVTAFIMYLNQFFRPIRMIADRINTFQMGVVSVNRIFEVLDEKQVEEYATHNFELIKNGNIQFENVYFSYDNGQDVLKKVSFELKEGEKLAIVGATGAGKTSIVNLLNRFYEIKSGRISIDRKSIEEYSLESLRTQIGIVLQDVFLFNGSVKDNLRLKNPAISDEKIVNAAKLIGVHELISSFPGGYDFMINERGTSLSVGQRQLLSFVRVILQDIKILILDEATSSIDSENEQLIQSAIDKILEGRTAIMIAHRLSTIQKADKIMVLDKGEIVEFGNQQSLLNIPNGHYKALYNAQF
jgi:ATP-binding cassette, subfamily B, multidrug efflux pump